MISTFFPSIIEILICFFSISNLSEILALIKQESNSSSLIENLEALLQKCDDQEFAKGNSSQVSLQEEYKLASLILKKVK